MRTRPSPSWLKLTTAFHFYFAAMLSPRDDDHAPHYKHLNLERVLASGSASMGGGGGGGGVGVNGGGDADGDDSNDELAVEYAERQGHANILARRKTVPVRIV
jgi:hypothetical protein